jgi:hypothetical protein
MTMPRPDMTRYRFSIGDAYRALIIHSRLISAGYTSTIHADGDDVWLLTGAPKTVYAKILRQVVKDLAAQPPTDA